MLLGRDEEIRRIDALISDARQGRSGVLVLIGEPGIGKTTLLRHARHHAEDLLVLSSAGIEGESAIPYANLADIFRPVYSLIKELPTRQAAALASAFAIGPSVASDRFVVAAGTLSLVSALAARGPALITVDDAQWVDKASQEAMTFVAHRLGAEGVAAMFAVRREQASGLRLDRFPVLELEGLTEEAARELVNRSSQQALSSSAVDRAWRETDGNPLALIEFPALVKPEVMTKWGRGRDPIPITSLLVDGYRGSVRDLPAETQSALSLLSVVGSLPTEVLETALLAFNLRTDALEPAERAGLVVLDAGQPVFRHPLIRAAVYQTTPSYTRRQAHLCAAEVLAQVDLPHAAERRAWHLVSAGGTSDEELASSLEKAADRELATANYAGSGLLYVQSASLTQGTVAKVERLIKGANGTRLSGDIEGARDLFRTAKRLNQDAQVGVLIDYLLCRIDIWIGSMADGRHRLLNLAESVGDRSPELTASMLADAALASTELGDIELAEEAVGRALVAARATREVPLSVDAVWAFVHGLRCDPAALTVLRSRAAEVEALESLTTDLTEQLVIVVSLAYLVSEDIKSAARVLERATLEARDRAALGVLPFRLGRMAWIDIWRGRWTTAMAAAYEALDIADHTGWYAERPNSLAALARIEAATGRDADCRAHAAEAFACAAQAGAGAYTAMAHAALGVLDISNGDHPEAIEHFRVADEFGQRNKIPDMPLLWWSADLIESLVVTEQIGDARRVLCRLEGFAVGSDRPALRAVMARCLALVEAERFEHHIDHALDWHRAALVPFEEARTRLLLGGHLRRRRHDGARDHLRAALTTFERLGAVAWAERARVELRAAGVRLPHPATGLEGLTPQELQVALAVGQGLSNRQVAAKLFLSIKTVEYHLSKCFLKLGVTRRTELVAIVARSTRADSGSVLR